VWRHSLRRRSAARAFAKSKACPEMCPVHYYRTSSRCTSIRHVAAEPASGGSSPRSPPSAVSEGRPRSLLRLGVTAPHGCRGERGACRRHLAVRDRAEGARLSALRGGSSTSPPPIATTEAWSQVTALREEAKGKGLNVEVDKLDVRSERDRNLVERWDLDVFISNAAIMEAGPSLSCHSTSCVRCSKSTSSVA